MTDPADTAARCPACGTRTTIEPKDTLLWCEKCGGTFARGPLTEDYDDDEA